jgi:hypothetical protein
MYGLLSDGVSCVILVIEAPHCAEVCLRGYLTRLHLHYQTTTHKNSYTYPDGTKEVTRRTAAHRIASLPSLCHSSISASCPSLIFESSLRFCSGFSSS